MADTRQNRVMSLTFQTSLNPGPAAALIAGWPCGTSISRGPAIHASALISPNDLSERDRFEIKVIEL